MKTNVERLRLTIIASLAPVILALGGGAYAWLLATKPAPPRRTVAVRALEVAVAPANPVTAAMPIIGHGTVRAKHEIKIVPQVSGKLVHVHPSLAPGKMIEEGELLFEIDPTVYAAQVQRVEAEARALEAALDRSDQELSNLNERITNGEKVLAIDEQDYLGAKRLYEDEQVGTPRDVDMVHQKYLRQKGALIELKSRRSMIPHIKLETEARLQATRAQLRSAHHNLENTKIFCPFNARVEFVSAYTAQVVTVPFSIATLTDMSAFELTVGIDPAELRWLEESIQLEALQGEHEGARPEVTVRWSLQGQSFTWRGFVTRFERVDEMTRTAQLVVEVRNADMRGSVELGNVSSRPTLAIGMYCRAELPAKPLKGALVVPRHAVYDNRWVYVFQPDEPGSSTGRLARRDVPLLRSMGDNVLVDYADRDGTRNCELRPGEQYIVSPLMKPVVGMPLRLREARVTALPTPRNATFPTAPASRGRTAVLAHVGLGPGGG